MVNIEVFRLTFVLYLNTPRNATNVYQTNLCETQKNIVNPTLILWVIYFILFFLQNTDELVSPPISPIPLASDNGEVNPQHLQV